MNQKILIVEDQFIEANHLRIMLQRADYSVCGVARSVEQAEEMIEKHRPDLVLLDIFLTGKRTGIDLAAQLKEANIPFIYLSANSNEEVLNAAKATHPYGFLVKPFRDNDLLVALQIAQYHHENGLESQLRKETQLQTQLATITAGQTNRQDRLLAIAQVLQPFISFDMLAVGSVEADGKPHHDTLHFLRIGFNEYQLITHEGLKVILGPRVTGVLDSKLIAASQVQYFNEPLFKSLASKPGMYRTMAETFGMKALLSLPLPPGLNGPLQCFFLFYSRHAEAYTADHISLSQRIRPFLVLATLGMPDMRVPAIAGASGPGGPAPGGPASGDTTPGLPEPSPNAVFENMIGSSPRLTAVFELISQVAPVDTSVLITGESGTGKERVADSIHTLSSRKDQPLIKVNCAALPANLIESELFGHEKGAFTGALEKRTGRFEQANGGTIFLDEIGDVPLETQVKLLRVLQQREIERIGGKAPVKINIRIIAATNKNLEKEVAEGRFRLDLYYRLNVFPIHLPSLSERKDDIPLLTHYFLKIYSRKAGRKIAGISDKALSELMSYEWPGNIRELENVIERCVLLAKGNSIEHVALPVSKPMVISEKAEEVRLKTIFENERDYIIQVLAKCNGRIRGEDGAAAILNIPPTTLASKIKKLGIKRNFSF